MIKFPGLLAIAFLSLPLSVNAAIIDIEYSGYVSGTEGNGLGFNPGDTVNGTLRIDTSYSSGDVWSETDKARYEAGPDQYDLVSGYHTSNTGSSVDFVEIYNDSRDNFMGGFEDFLSISDSNSAFFFTSDNTYTSDFFSIQLQFAFQGIDWITSESLDNVNILVNDLVTMGPSWGVMTNSYGSGDFSGNYSAYSDTAFLNFTSVNIKSINVPAPGSLMLLLIGVAGLLLCRRKV